MKIWIAGVGHALPEQVVTNQELIDRHALRIKASWVESKIGVSERRWVSAGEAASDLAVTACLACAGFDAGTFEGSIWVSTISPDYLTPSTASIIKGKLGLKGDQPAFDLSAACAGHLFALDAAAQRLRGTEETEALVIASEVRSAYLNKADRRTAFLFGDGAAAFYLKKSHGAPGELEWTYLATRPSLDAEILVPGGGSRQPLTPETLAQGLQYIKMNDGEKISEVTTTTLVEELRRVLKLKGRTPADFDFFVFHQGNGAIAAKICDALGVPAGKTLSNFNKYGNTSSASLGIALSEAQSLGKISSGDRVLLMAMGAGYHFGIASLVWGIG
jgi:3-oxoacyl-[acyl-carrier-protein] synthase-3